MIIRNVNRQGVYLVLLFLTLLLTSEVHIAFSWAFLGFCCPNCLSSLASSVRTCFQLFFPLPNQLLLIHLFFTFQTFVVVTALFISSPNHFIFMNFYLSCSFIVILVFFSGKEAHNRVIKLENSIYLFYNFHILLLY